MGTALNAYTDPPCDPKGSPGAPTSSEVNMSLMKEMAAPNCSPFWMGRRSPVADTSSHVHRLPPAQEAQAKAKHQHHITTLNITMH